MGTKANPAQFDCYANALPDEPMFVLLARDPLAPGQVREWADLREEAINTGNQPESDRAMVDEARACALNMEQWRKDNNGKWRITMPNPQPTQMEQRMDDPLCERCGCYRSAHGEDERCEPVGWSFRPAADLGDDGGLVQASDSMENRQAGVLGVSRSDFTDAVKSVLRAHFNGLSGDDELSPSEEDYLAERVHRRIAGLVRQKSQRA